MLSRTPQRDMLFGLLCAGALGSLATFYGFNIFYWSRDQATYASARNKGYNTHNTKEQESPLGNWITRDASGFFTMCLVIVGFGQAGLFIWQLNLIREGLVEGKESADAANLSAQIADDSLNLSREVAQRQLRAYVTGGPKFIYSFTPTSNVRCEVYLRNDGVTPAFDTRHRSAIGAFIEPLPDGFKFPDIETIWSPFFVIFPRDTFQGTSSRSSFSTEEIELIKTGTKRIYIWGEILYSDAFGIDHFTRFYSRVAYDAEMLEKLASNYQPTDLRVSFETVGRMEAN
jgi:hypothetical protein